MQQPQFIFGSWGLRDKEICKDYERLKRECLEQDKSEAIKDLDAQIETLEAASKEHSETGD